MFKTKISLLSLLMLISSIGWAQLSGSYTVDPSGGGDYKTINEAVADLQTQGISANTTINIKGGTYTEQVTISNIKGISATNRLVFKGAGIGNTVVENKTTTNTERHVIRVEDLSYVTVRDMSILSTASSYGWGFHAYNSSTSSSAAMKEVQLINCDIEVPAQSSSNYWGVIFNRSTSSYSTSGSGYIDCLIDSCEISGGYGSMYFCSTRSSASAYGNTISNNTFTEFYQYGIYLNSLYGIKIDRNFFDGESSSRNPGYGIQFLNNTSGGTNVVEITNNTMVGLNQYGISLLSVQGGNSTTNSAQRGKITNNSIHMVGSGSTSTYGIYNNSSYVGYFDVFHNTIVLANTNTSTSSTCLQFYGNYSTIKNNNLAYLAATGNAQALEIGTPGADLVVDYNNYYTGGSSAFITIGASYSASNFKNAGGYNANSFNVDPNIISSNDLHLDSTKVFVAGDASVGIALDIDGDERCSFAPSIGSDESRFKLEPKSSFISVDTVIVNSPFTFLNQAKSTDPLMYSWLVDKVEESTDFHFTHTFTSTGTYELTLRSSSCAGIDKDSTVKVHVVNPSKKPIADFSIDKTVIETGQSIALTDLSGNGPASWNWSVSPDSFYNADLYSMDPTFYYINKTDERSTNPEMVFDHPGLYDIKLVVTNSVGMDSVVKVEVLEVIQSINMCAYPDFTTLEKGIIYDDGGANNNYNRNRNCTYLIKPCGGEVVLDFEYLNLSTNDYLRIYNGSDNSGTPLWDVTNSPLGFNGSLTNFSVTAPSGKMYLEFESDNNTTTVATGFKANWSVKQKNIVPPVASFTAPDTVCTDVETIFINNTSGTFVEYQWYINGVPEGKGLANFDYYFAFSGTYEIKLIAENCGGKDSMVQNITVAPVTKAPKPNFSAAVQKPNLGEVVVLQNTTSYCFEDQSWTISPRTFSYVNGTDSTDRFPEVVFTKAGCYDIGLSVSNSQGSNSITKTCFIEAGNYCIPVVKTLSSDLGITSFNMEQVSQSSPAAERSYTSYASSQKMVLTKGASYPFELTRGGSSVGFSAAIWIDLNGDGTFSNSELLAQTNGNSSQNWMDTIKIPVTASTTQTRLRIQTTSSAATLRACGPSTIGEYEDYLVQILEDNDIPVISLKGLNPMSLEAGKTYKEPGFSAFDNQSGDITDDVTVSNGLINTTVGSYKITYDVTDEAGNKANTVTRIVDVTPDTTAPTITVVGNLNDTIKVGDSYVELGASAFDTLDGTLSITMTGTVDSSKIGTYAITYTATDAANNIKNVTRYVTVIDDIKPSLTLNNGDSVNLQILTSYVDSGITLTDNHDAYSEMTISINTDIDTSEFGTYFYQICATDQSGNDTCLTRYVTVVDTLAPMLSLRGNDSITVEVNSNFNDPWINTSDDYYTTVNITTSGTFTGVDKIGSFTLIYTAEDGSGNQASVTRYIFVEDNTAPTLELLGDEIITVDRWSDFVDPGYKVSDNYTEEAMITVTTGGDFSSTTSAGRYYITYVAEDEAGNKSVTKTRIVDIITTSIKELNAVHFDVFPNPASTNLNLKIAYANAEINQIAITDISGRVVYQQDASGKEYNGNINVSNLKPGTYMIVVTTNQGVGVSRLSIVK